MKRTQKARRRYDSPRRQAQAGDTRRRILEAARAEFSNRGYAGATMERIAADAGVAPETVYAGFGSKRNLLAALIDLAVGGDDQPIPLLMRPGPQSVLQQPDPAQQLRRFAEDISQILARVSPLFEVLRMAAKTEPEIADLVDGLLQARLRNLHVLAESLAAHGGLRSGLTSAAAAETVWAITSPEMFLLFTRDRRWAQDQYVDWLEDALARLLLT